MSLATEREITDLKTELARLKAENNYLRKKLYQKQSHILQLEDVALTPSERKILLANKLPVN